MVLMRFCTGINRVLALIGFFALFGSSLSAQTPSPNDNSPFAIYGLGNFLDPDFIYAGNMGGLSAGFHDAYNWSVDNPASLAYLQSVSFNAATYVERSQLNSNLEEGAEEATVWNGNIRYLALGMPLRNTYNVLEERKQRDFNVGLGVSLLPYTRAAQSIRIVSEDEETGRIEQDILRTGGTFKLRGGLGARYKQFSAGINMGYLFGSLDKTQVVLLPEDPSSSQTIFEQSSQVAGLLFDYGLMYDISLGDKGSKKKEKASAKKLVVGIHSSLGSDFTTRNSNFGRAQHATGVIDTAVFNRNVKENGKLGSETTFGITYQDSRRLNIGINYTIGQWTDYFNDANPEELNDSWELGLGGTWRPDPSDILTFWNRVGYQVGFKMGKDPRLQSGEQIEYMSIRAGVELPLVYNRQISHLNLGFEYGRTNAALIDDTTWRVNFGINFNDNNWFLKRKYN